MAVALVTAVAACSLIGGSSPVPTSTATAPTGVDGAVNFDRAATSQAGTGATKVDLWFDPMCPICGTFEKANGELLAKAVADGSITLRLRPLTFLDRLSNGTGYSTSAVAALTCVAVNGTGQGARVLPERSMRISRRRTPTVSRTNSWPSWPPTRGIGDISSCLADSGPYQAWAQANTAHSQTGPDRGRRHEGARTHRGNADGPRRRQAVHRQRRRCDRVPFVPRTATDAHESGRPLPGPAMLVHGRHPLKPSREAGKEVSMTARTVLQQADITRALTRISHEILESNRGTNDLVILGIPTRGVAARAAHRARSSSASSPGTGDLVGALDVTMYRDDLVAQPDAHAAARPQCPAGGSTARPSCSSTTCSTRAAPSAPRSTRSATSGGPRAVRLAVLVDRGHRELPDPRRLRRQEPAERRQRAHQRAAHRDRRRRIRDDRGDGRGDA